MLAKFLFSFLLAASLSCTQAAADAPIVVEGLLKDVVRDPVDPNYRFLLVLDAEGPIIVPLKTSALCEKLEQSVGATIQTFGTIRGKHPHARHFADRELAPLIRNGTEVVRIVRPAPDSPFENVKDLSSLSGLSPADIVQKGFRMARGRIIAVWHPSTALLQTESNGVVQVEFKAGKLPHPGEDVEVVGFPETDIYQLRLIRSVWRASQPLRLAPNAVQDISARQFLILRSNDVGINVYLHGKTVRIRGIVRSLPNAIARDALVYLDDDGTLVPVDVSAAPDAAGELQIGCIAEVTGVCVMDIDIWRPNAAFPRIRGYTLVTRSATDIVILARPSWLTPAVLLTVIAILLLALVGVGIRNRFLKRLAELRVRERTRLAVEVHDALSQNLTGIAFELQTVSVLADGDPAAAKEHLAIANKSLLSCRGELRNCLDDLRSDALENDNIEDAIRQTLASHLKGESISIRFRVRRRAMSDNVLHAVLCIIRELTLNALRHGHATSAWIAGTQDGERLLFSVRDNGCGFDPESRPGVRDGHFGLQGITERASTFDGSVVIRSQFGRGTKVTVSMNLTQETQLA